jgi:hypothetical protein
MNCRRFDEIVHELDRPGRLDGFDRQSADEVSETDTALAHAESCSRCGQLLTEVEGLNLGLRTLASHEMRETAPARLEATLLREFRRQSAYGKRVGRSGQVTAERRPYRLYAVAAGIAALALLAIGLWLVRAGAGSHQEPSRATVATSQTPEVTKKPLEMQQEVTESSPARRNATAKGAAETEDATTFYALPYADGSASIEGGAVIRVAVPGSALASWGLPVSGIAAGEQVPADMLVSADGTPQAIRLVSQTSQ